MADHLLRSLAEHLSIVPDGHNLLMSVQSEAVREAKSLLPRRGKGQPLIAINVGASRPQKRWPFEHFAEVARQLDARGIAVVLLGGSNPEDQGAASEIKARLEQSCSGALPTNLVGGTSLQTLAAVIDECDAIVTADTGAMHIASALKTPLVALFGSTDPSLTGPYGNSPSRILYKHLACAPCGNHPTCGGRFDCMRDITPEDVVSAVGDLLRRERSIPINVVSSPKEPLPMPTERRQSATRLDTVAPVERILVFTKYRFIGDTLLAIPTLRAAARQWPNARLTLVTGARACELLQNCPYVHEFIEFDPYRPSDRGALCYARLIRKLRQRRFDLALVLNRSFHSALTAALAGARVRTGWAGFQGRDFLLQRRCSYGGDDPEITSYLDVLRLAAPNIATDFHLHLWVTKEERGDIPAEVRMEGEWIGVQPGASHDYKRWPAERYAALIDHLLDADPSRRIILLGGPEEREAAAAVLSQCASELRPRIANYVGELRLRQTLGVMTHLSWFVGNDTAVRHAAVALDIPSIGLFGPTNARKWGNGAPPRHCVITAPNATMEEITVKDAISHVRLLQIALSDRTLAPATGASTHQTSMNCHEV